MTKIKLTRKDPYTKMISILNDVIQDDQLLSLPLGELIKQTGVALLALDTLLNFGFEFDGKTYIIRGDDILGKHWTHNLASVVARTEAVPKLYIALNNLMVDLNQFIGKLKMARKMQIEKIWEERDDPTSVVYQASVNRMSVYIESHQDLVKLDTKIEEIKGYISKLKGILTALTMQNSALVALIYHNKTSQHVFQDALGSLTHGVRSDEEI